MTRAFVRATLLFTVIVASIPARGESSQPPEFLLAEESVLYYRFDGMGTHQDAYRQTIFAQLLKNEFGPLVNDLSQRILDALGPELLSERLLSGIKPDQLLNVQKATLQIPHLKKFLVRNGFVVGVEVIDPLKYRFQVTVVFSNGGTEENRSALLAGFRLLGLLSETEVQEIKHGKLTLLQLDTPKPVRVLCWQEGTHMVLTIGTEEIDHTLNLARGKRKNLTAHTIYKQLADFNRYESFQRGFLDVDRVIQIAYKSFPPAVLILDKLGLLSLKNVRFQIGFQKQHLRSTIVFDVPGKREGVLRLLGSAEALDMNGLPHIPPDAVSVSASRFDLATTYDSVVGAIELIIGTTEPADLKEFQQGLKSVESALGIDLRKDLFANLGQTLVVYNSTSEGPFNMGMGFVIRVKDSAKLSKSLETIMKSLPAIIGADFEVKKRNYRGTVMHTVHVEAAEFPFAPSYAIHNGWLVVGFFPQTVQGFIYRSDGKHPVWNLPPVAISAISDASQIDPQARLTSISVSDPKPTIEQILSFSPILIKVFSSIAGESSNFDSSLIPNAQTVTDRLTHNVSISFDNGKSVRMEGYSSLPTLMQLNGVEAYMYLMAFSIFGFAF